ncbi:MAG: TonB-dependent receptor [Bacteroidales bacterium]|nr:TonB-dependent receptor [Bacteroidales bacterium]
MKIITYTCITILFFTNIYSQTGVIRGFIYDKKNSEPIPFANIILVGTKYGTTSDINGFFSIAKLKPGKYILKVSFVGYDTATVIVHLKENEIITKKIFLEESTILLSEVNISAEAKSKTEQVKISINKITPKLIERLPSIGAEPDFAQYVQVLPGVVFTGDQGGQLFIRGGSPVQNKVLLDGMTIFNPFHSIGFFSVFDSDILKNADVYTGAFNSEYGGRISSVMDISTKDGNKNRHSGKISATTFGSKLLIEGPIFKSEDISKTAMSYIFSGKTSYIKESSKVLYSYVDTLGIPFSFNDFYGKISLTTENGSKINFFGFNFYDKVKYRALSLYEWNNKGFGSNIIIVPVGSIAIMKINFNYSKYEITLKESDDLPRYSSINNFYLSSSLNYFYGSSELKYGIEAGGLKTDFSFYNINKRLISQQENTTEINGFINYKIKTLQEKLIVESGVRLQFYASLPKLSLEPRAGLKYIVTKNLRLKIASGLYSQNILSANSDRDVVNLFYGFLSNVDLSRLPKYFEGKEITNPLQRSFHIVTGFEVDPSEYVEINIEPYYKKFIFLTNINRNKIFDDTGDNWQIPDILKKDFIAEKGNAYGCDFSIKYEYKRNYLWLAYSLGYVDRYDGVYTYNPIYDRRHNLNILLTRTFGKNLDWDISLRWNLGSGLPFTKTAGYYEQLNIYNINTNLASANANLGVLYGNLNNGRLPYYHRLDITVKKSYDFSKNSTLEIIFSITNLYNRKNIFYYDRLRNEFINQLPIIPSVGLNLTF